MANQGQEKSPKKVIGPVIDLTGDDPEPAKTPATRTPGEAHNLAKELFGSGIKPKGTIKKISLAEQRELTATANRVARDQGPKRKRCKVCKIWISNGCNQAKGLHNVVEHELGKQHQHSLQLLDETWKKGCFTCPNKSFTSRQQCADHLKSKAHEKKYVSWYWDNYFRQKNQNKKNN